MVSPYYDSMVAKVIAHGATRADAARKLTVALERATIVGSGHQPALLIDLMSRDSSPRRRRRPTTSTPAGSTARIGDRPA